MKKKFISKKIKLFMSLIFVCCLTCYISAFIVLFNSGYSFSKFSSNLKSLNLSTVKFYLSKNYFDFSFNKSTSLNEYTVDNNIDSIYFNIASQDIKIQIYDGDVIQVRVKGPKFLNNVDLIASKNDRTMIFSSSNNMNSDLDILVNIPRKFISSYDIDINTSTGDIYAYNICTDSLNLSTYDGDIYISNSSANYLNLKNSKGDINIINNNTFIESKISLNSGDLSATGDLGLLTVNNISGDITLSLNQISKDISLTCVSGDITLLVPPNSNYKTDYSSIHGNLLCSQSALTQGDERHNINIITTTGDTFIGCK